MAQRLRQELARLRECADIIDHEYRIESKLPVIGPLVAWVRRNLTSHLREPYLDPALKRQVNFNDTIADILQLLLARETVSPNGLPKLDLSGRPIDEMATDADIFYAYRLILGRMPDQNGWEHYCTRIGHMSIAQLTDELMFSPEFKEREVFYKLTGTYRAIDPIRVDLGPYAQYVMPNDQAIGMNLKRDRVWEPSVTRHLSGLLQAGMTFMDLGANIGYYTLLAAHRVGPQGRVVAFEPDQQNCTLIQMSVLDNGFENVELFPLAAADHSATFAFELRDGSNGMLTEELSASSVSDVRRLLSRKVVRAVAIDEILHHLDRLDVMKIDVEGAEYRALRGMEALLTKHRPIIFSEFSPIMLQSVSGVSGEDYLAWLIKHGYAISVINSKNGELQECGDDIAAVMQLYEKEPTRLIDLFARPDK